MASGGLRDMTIVLTFYLESFAQEADRSTQLNNAPRPQMPARFSGQSSLQFPLGVQKLLWVPLLETGMPSFRGVSSQGERGQRSSEWPGTLTLSPSQWPMGYF